MIAAAPSKLLIPLKCSAELGGKCYLVLPSQLEMLKQFGSRGRIGRHDDFAESGRHTVSWTQRTLNMREDTNQLAHDVIPKRRRQ